MEIDFALFEKSVHYVPSLPNGSGARKLRDFLNDKFIPALRALAADTDGISYYPYTGTIEFYAESGYIGVENVVGDRRGSVSISISSFSGEECLTGDAELDGELTLWEVGDW